MARIEGNILEQRIRKCFQGILYRGSYTQDDVENMESLYSEGIAFVRDGVKHALDIKEE